MTHQEVVLLGNQGLRGCFFVSLVLFIILFIPFIIDQISQKLKQLKQKWNFRKLDEPER